MIRVVPSVENRLPKGPIGRHAHHSCSLHVCAVPPEDGHAMRKSGAARFRKHRPLIGSWCRASPKRVRLVICKTQTQTRDITAPRDILLDKHDVLRLYAHDFATMRLSGHIAGQNAHGWRSQPRRPIFAIPDFFWSGTTNQADKWVCWHPMSNESGFVLRRATLIVTTTDQGWRCLAPWLVAV